MTTNTNKSAYNKVVKHDAKEKNISNNQQNVQTPAEIEKSEAEKKAINENREILKARSQEVKKLVESGEFQTINDAIMETMYRNETHQDFKSYGEWQKEGFQVRKGEKAFLLWGRPKEVPNSKEKDDKGQELEADEKHEYFPVSYLFSNSQVDKKEHELEELPKFIIIDDIDDIRNAEHEEELER